jgi:transcriptional regulator NrdR family protein
MHCPMCGAWSLIKETRTNKIDNIVNRRYECGNTHRFSTEEKIKNGTEKQSRTHQVALPAAPRA